jgi:hypothetical protein
VPPVHPATWLAPGIAFKKQSKKSELLPPLLIGNIAVFIYKKCQKFLKNASINPLAS